MATAQEANGLPLLTLGSSISTLLYGGVMLFDSLIEVIQLRRGVIAEPVDREILSSESVILRTVLEDG